MEYTTTDGEVLVALMPDFEPERIFECGQCFRWSLRSDGSWEGIARGRVLTLRKTDRGIAFRCGEDEFLQIWFDYFDLGRDYVALRTRISTDPFTARAAEFGTGIRILKQDPWEALCTFILSQCNNIGRIKGLVERICRLFGEEITCDGKRFHLFPSPARLASLAIEDMEPLRAGYRSAYILGAAREVADGSLVLEDLRSRPTDDAIRALTGLHGVGVKVASCAALFGLGKTDAFPIDVWMRRAIENHYGGKRFDSALFGDDAGIAQQYIFYYIRSLKGIIHEGYRD